MRITTIIFSIQVCFTTLLFADSLKAQTISLDLENASVKKVFASIEKQSGVSFVYSETTLKDLSNISIKADRQPLQYVLKDISTSLPLEFKVSGMVIGVSRIMTKTDVNAQPEITPQEQSVPKNLVGKVTGENDTPLHGATIKIKGTNISTATDGNGEFRLSNVPDSATLIVSFIGYKTKEIKPLPTSDPIVIRLEPDASQLKEVVVSTGYQQIPKERATGSFDQIDNDLLNRRVSTNILDRIDGIASGVLFNGTAAITSIATNPALKNTGITIRGVSTLNSSTEPLIVVDNFPYEGEMSNINPNDIENITILKDAAAASIWGVRSGNGVIVITTKKGKLNQKMQVEFNSNVTIINKPNLFYAPNFLDPSSYIGVEKYLFNQGYFDSFLSDTYDNPSLSPAVNILAQERAGTISESQANAELSQLAQHDVRNDYDKYVYQKAVNQQYSLGIRGGDNDMTYQLSVGQDNDRSNLVRNGFDRTTINSTNTYTPIKNLEITAGINYSQSNTILDNNFSFGSYTGMGYPYGNIYPYASLADAKGNPLAIPAGLNEAYLQQTKSEGFLDWQYVPLNEIQLGDNNTKVNDVLLKAGIKYRIIPQLSAQVNYQNEHQTIDGRNYQSQDTYYVRNLINQFSSYDPTNGITYNVPLGGILDLSNTDWSANNLRAQLNYDQSFGDASHRQNLTALAGAEVRQLTTNSFDRTSYGYNDQFGSAVTNLNYSTFYFTNPSGIGFIPTPDGLVSGVLNRYVSYFANAAYNYQNKYTVTISGREDGANLFGAKTNDKIAPLWSAGLGWNLNKEDFYHMDWLPYLKLRATYGYNGNTYQNGSAYLIGYYSGDPVTGANVISSTTAPNPELRWEKVRNINLGVDFATKNNVLSGTIELYQKMGEDLIQATPLAPQTGFSTYLANTASTRTDGIDITLQSENLQGPVKWNTVLLLSATKDKIIKDDVIRINSSIDFPGGVVGKPLEGLFSYKWAGLDPTNGDPQGYLNGKVSKDYTSIINNYNPDSLVFSGSLVPTVYGSLRNDFAYKNFSLSVNIVYQLGFVFRRTTTSLNYTDILQYGQNEDYTQRWQKPGDEQHTNVPSLVYPSNGDRNTFYQYSQVLVEPGDNIRLQDIRLAYDLPESVTRKIHASRISIFTYANNIGIIWRKNKIGIDPDAVGNGLATYPNPFSLSFGLNANF